MSFQTNARGLRLGFFRKWDSTGFNEIYNYNENIFKYLNTLKYLENILEMTRHNIYLVKLNYIKLGTKKIYIVLYYHNLELEDDRLYSMLMKRTDSLVDRNKSKVKKFYKKIYSSFFYRKWKLRLKQKKKTLNKRSLKKKKNWEKVHKNLFNKVKKNFKSTQKQRLEILGKKNISTNKIYKSFFKNYKGNVYLKNKRKNFKNKNITKKENTDTSKLYKKLHWLKKKTNVSKKWYFRNRNYYVKKLNKNFFKFINKRKKVTNRNIQISPINNGKKKKLKIKLKKKKKLKNLQKNKLNLTSYLYKNYYRYLLKHYYKNKIEINIINNILLHIRNNKLTGEQENNAKPETFNISETTVKNNIKTTKKFINTSALNKINNLKFKWYLYKHNITLVNNLFLKKKNIYLYFFFKKLIINNKLEIYKKKSRTKHHSLKKKNKKYLINVLDIKKLKKNLSILTNTNINIFAINAKNLLRFALNNIDEKTYFFNLFKKSTNYYESIMQNYMDIIYIFFYSFLFKDAKILTKLINFIFKKRRKYVRDGSVVNFIRQLLPTVVNHFPDVDAVRIKIKGRLNNRKRSRTDFIRHNLITNHKISYFTDYDSTHFITSSGALGFKIWISFYPTAKQNHIAIVKKYLLYSKLKNDKKI